ncbi:MAG: carbon starvation protein A [bacterium]|nr:carbon starvation protein A [bacterium]
MSILLFIALAFLAFWFGLRYYAKLVAKWLGENPSRLTPAVKLNDGHDYVPTKRYVVFAHHFATIAGAGPILGPTMAALYGFIPAWLWILLGGIFFGAVHDFTSLFVSMREGGKSMAEIAKKTLGNTGFKLFILFTILMIVLVTSAFLNATAISLTSVWPLEKIGGNPKHTLLHTFEKDGVVMAKIGGIASMSVIVITLFSPMIGWLIYRKKVSPILSYGTAALVCVLSIVLGFYFPITLSPKIWMIVITIYVLIASGLPVWIIMQPRDFVNVQILYGGILMLLLSVFIAGFQGNSIHFPAFNVSSGIEKLGLIWPMMFITIACGAISGFHSLVAGGTTGKQIMNETDARKVGYYAMILESALAVCVLIAVGVAFSFTDYQSLVWPDDPNVKSNPILAFSLAAGNLFYMGLKVPIEIGTVFGILLVEGFIVTTLDTAVRLNRYLFEELWGMIFREVPSWLRQPWVNAAISVFFMWILATTNAFSVLWPIFGTTNQMLAALSLLAVSAWLLLRRKKFFFTLVPAIFMLVTTVASLLILLQQYILKKNYVLLFADTFLLILAISVTILTLKTFLRPNKGELAFELEEETVQT